MYTSGPNRKKYVYFGTLKEKIKLQKQSKARVFTYGNDIKMVWF